MKAQQAAETPVPLHSTVVTLQLMVLFKTICKAPSQHHMKWKSSLPLQNTSNRDHLWTSIYSDQILPVHPLKLLSLVVI